MKEIKITKSEENQRLDKFLLKYMNQASKGFVYKMLRKKRIKYNGIKAEGGELLQAGDTLQLYLAEETISSFMQEKTLQKAERHFAVIYEDEDILILSKPAGLLTHPEKSGDKNTLIDQVLYYLYEKGQYTPKEDTSFTPALCNRLDRNTSGLILAGKTLKGVQALNEAIRSKKIEKYYWTLVKGVIKEGGEISAYLTKDNESNRVRISKEAEGGSVSSLTRYRPLATNNEFTLLEVNLITGKTHQIRAHMQSIHHPIVGDRKYGEESSNFFFRREFGLNNQFLHSGRLCFQTEEGPLAYLFGKAFTAPLPKTVQQITAHLFGDTLKLE